jgi:XapX domain-containing protein
MNIMLSFIMGLVVGAIYSIFNVRSPAPPLIALIGLLGMVIGEKIMSNLAYFK